MEGMTDPTTGKPGNCVYPAAEEPYPPAEGGYTAARNPFVFFHTLLDLGDCTENDLPLTSLDANLRKKADATANVSFITPTLCNSGSTAECPEGQVGGPAAADAFLDAWVPKITRLAGLQGRRPADRHLQLARPGRRRPTADGPRPVAQGGRPAALALPLPRRHRRQAV